MATVVVTGASSGVGYEACRQLAALSTVGKIVVTCRTVEKGEATVAKLAAESGGTCDNSSRFSYVVLDCADRASVLAAVDAMPPKVDRLCLNAGTFGNGLHAESGCTEAFSVTLGHTLLVDGLLANGKIAEGARVLFVGGELARTMRALTGLQIGAPDRGCCGCGRFGEKDLERAMTRPTCSCVPLRAQVQTMSNGKIVGMLHFAAMARERPGIYWAVTSPGATVESNFAANGKFPFACLARHCGCLFTCLRVAHGVSDGGMRYVELLTEDGIERRFPSGSMPMAGYDGCCCLWGARGSMVDNRPFAHYFGDEALQDQAAAAVRAKQAAWEQTAGTVVVKPQAMGR